MPELVGRASRSDEAWPAAVFDAPVLRGLEPRARREIEDAGRLVTAQAGEVLYRAGDGGESFFVVATGEVVLRALRRGDGEESELRVADAGDAFGEEATVGSRRSATALVKSRATIAEIPVHVFRRAAGRSGKAEIAERLERILRRRATRDLLGTLALTRDLPESDVDLLLDAIRHQHFERGQTVYRQGDPAEELWLVGDGMVQIQSDDGERFHVRAYVARGDFFGDAEITERAPRSAAAVASGPSLLLSIPAPLIRDLAARHPELLPRLRRVAAEQHAHQQAIVGRAANVTQHVFRDLYRLQVARSLLVIDLDSCVRCGHCAWACQDLYGVARLVRRGDKIVTRAEDETTRASTPQSLLLPNSCQHCENPSCMVDCPTGAIGRDPDGEVFIRDNLCTGCGACAKACPWDNIQMAVRPAAAPRPSGGSYPELAVKCDLCRSYDAGPACVQACPTSSIVRINPTEEIADVRELLGGARAAVRREAPARSAAPVVGAAIAAAAIGVTGAVMQARGAWRPARGVGYGAGIAAALGIALLLAYALPKRGVRLWMRRRRATKASDGAPGAGAVESVVRPHATLHLVIGLLTMGAVLVHAPWPPAGRPSVGGALYLAFFFTALAGCWTGLAYRFVPRRLSRIERTAALPEDFAGARRALLDRIYRETTGRSDLVKKIVERILLPYSRKPLGPLALLASGRSVREEETALHARIERVLEGRGKERLAGLAELVRIVVELRSLPAQRALLASLRFGLPLHVVTFGIAVVLLVLHITGVVRQPG